MAVTPSKEAKPGMDSGKYVRYTPEQVEALEKLYHECPKPNSMRRQQVIRECPILSNIEPKQIKVWFQNRRYCGNKFIEDKKNYRRNLVEDNLINLMYLFSVLFLCVCLVVFPFLLAFFRCREKQRKEASRLQAVNRKLTAMNKLLMEENDRLQKQVSQLVTENGFFRQKTQNVREVDLFHVYHLFFSVWL